jgi:hypothetical protein
MEVVTARPVARVDRESLVRDVPRGLERQVCAMSVMGIDLNSARQA